jgi:SAM-dependent methyltransferase
VPKVSKDLTPYLRKRAENNAFWAGRARQEGSSLAATDTTGWVRTASLRRLRKFVRPNDRVLEVGCGNGSSFLASISRKCRVLGVDLTFEMLQLAKQYLDIKGLVQSDACWLPFADQSFDVVYTSRCLINVLDPEMQQQALSELFRVVKQSGTVILIENFVEPLTRLCQARERFHAGPPLANGHNLAINLDDALKFSRQLGWFPCIVRGNTIASIVSCVIVPWITRGSGESFLECLLYPLYVALTIFEDAFGKRSKPVGKDVLVAFRRNPLRSQRFPEHG